MEEILCKIISVASCKRFQVLQYVSEICINIAWLDSLMILAMKQFQCYFRCSKIITHFKSGYLTSFNQSKPLIKFLEKWSMFSDLQWVFTVLLDGATGSCLACGIPCSILKALITTGFVRDPVFQMGPIIYRIKKRTRLVHPAMLRQVFNCLVLTIVSVVENLFKNREWKVDFTCARARKLMRAHTHKHTHTLSLSKEN